MALGRSLPPLRVLIYKIRMVMTVATSEPVVVVLLGNPHKRTYLAVLGISYLLALLFVDSASGKSRQHRPSSSPCF